MHYLCTVEISDNTILNRVRLLVGSVGLERLDTARIIVFGIGGVGSWCVEALVRTGVRHVTIVDCDNVCPSNINRQLMANVNTVGQLKVEALKTHLLTVLPSADIETRSQVFNAETAESFNLDDYDYVIDAIDSLADKALLINMATRSRAKLYSSMGAALKLDPTKIKVAEFWSVKGCPLARALRQRFKKTNIRPYRRFKCVYSDELLSNQGEAAAEQVSPHQATTNGSLMHITAIFGEMLAGLVIKDIVSKNLNNKEI